MFSIKHYITCVLNLYVHNNPKLLSVGLKSIQGEPKRNEVVLLRSCTSWLSRIFRFSFDAGLSAVLPKCTNRSIKEYHNNYLSSDHSQHVYYQLFYNTL